MLRSRRLWFCGFVIGVVVAPTIGASVGGGDAAIAQDDDGCWEWVQPIIDYDENGDPIFGAERLVNTCDSGDDGSSDGGPYTCQHDTLGTVPCTHDVYGWWSSSEDCYVSLMSPQPSADDEAWGDNSPDDGAIYQLACPQTSIDDLRVRPQFMAQAPQLPSPGVLAERAFDTLPLVGAEIGIAPSPDGVGLVGVPVWLWTENTPATWGPLTTTVSVPGLAVTAEANAVEIEWDMGNGHVEVCDNPGQPYQASFGGREPDCGYTYPYPSSTQPDGRYTVTATTIWEVNWWVEPRGNAEEGQDSFTRVSEPVSIQINELQVVTG